ncbi:MAG TPA: MFS transporter [Actinomycetota bacterium]|nr:MFS transporter [Actinomycetota bacterium]
MPGEGGTRGPDEAWDDDGAELAPPLPPRARAGAFLRRLAIDVTPLRVSRDYRLLWTGQLISTVGRQVTLVALPFQVFQLTRSSLAVGLIGLAEVVPLVLSSVGGGPLVDRFDRRRLLLVTEVALAVTTSLLLVGALMGDPPVGYLYGVAALHAAISGLNWPTRSAVIPNVVSREQLPAAMALNQVLFNSSTIVGPALAGLLIAQGLPWAYGTDLASFVGSISAAALLRPLPPARAEGQGARGGLGAVAEGFAYLRRQRLLVSTFVIDLVAMVFGMPRAVFPELAEEVFRVGAQGLGLLYSAPAVGALLGALTAGWVGRVRRQGVAVVAAVVVWGTGITAFGLSGDLFPLALLFLALAGAADVVSAVFRGTILQLTVPDALRGRISAVNMMVVAGGPRLGDVEAGAVASLVSPWFSVVSGGVACVVGALAVARWFPELRRYRAPVGR